jgi:hypothetical protein
MSSLYPCQSPSSVITAATQSLLAMPVPADYFPLHYAAATTPTMELRSTHNL